MKKQHQTRWLGRAMCMLMLGLSTTANAQTSIPCDSYDFTTSTGWTAVGTTVAISGGKITATSTGDGSIARYVHATLGTPLTNTWTCDFEFKATGDSGPAHSLVSFTEGSGAGVVNAHGYWSSGTMYYNQTHCIEAYIIAPYGSTNTANWELRAASKLRTSATYGSTSGYIPWSTSPGIPLGAGAFGTTFYARLQRLDQTHGMISMYSDAARTTLIASECFSINAGVTGLTAVQSGNQPEGSLGRVFSGTVDNITVCNLNPVLSGTSTFCASAAAKTYVLWNGNSNVTASDCGFPGATSFTWYAPAGSSFPAGIYGTCNSGSSGLHNDCSIDVNTTGVVSCDVQYSCGTVITYTFGVTVNPSPTAVFTGGTSFCAGAPIYMSGGASQFETQYSWEAIECNYLGIIPIGATWCTQPFVTGTAGTVDITSILGCTFTCGKYYKVRLRTKNSCTTTTSSDHIFFINCLPTVTASADVSICPGSCTTISASGASTYSWSPTTGLGTPGLSSTSACPGSTQVYTVTGTATSGCTNTDAVTVTVSSAPTVSLGSDQVLCCANHTTTYTINPTESGTAPFTYAWTSSPAGATSILTCSHGALHTGTTCPDPWFTWPCPGFAVTYYVTVTDANGCTDTDDIIFTTNPGCRVAQNAVEEHDHQPAAAIYPNPATKQITINTTGVAEQIFITDALGRNVLSVQPVAEQTQIDLSGLSPGSYFVNIQNAENVQTERLIIEE